MQQEGKMLETEITFHNKTEIRVQAQIYVGRTMVSTCVVDPGQIRSVPANSLRYDVFFKNGATGWEIARKLDSDARNFTLSKNKSRYTIQEANNNARIASTAEPKTTANEVAN
jgi:hypothetical protein